MIFLAGPVYDYLNEKNKDAIAKARENTDPNFDFLALRDQALNTGFALTFSGIALLMFAAILFAGEKIWSFLNR